MIPLCSVRTFVNCNFALSCSRTKLIFSNMLENKISPILTQNINESHALIENLKHEVKQVVSLLQQKHEKSIILKLKEENKLLSEKIALAKKELIDLQISNGVPQISVPGDEQDVKTQSIPCKPTSIKPSIVISDAVPPNEETAVTNKKPTKVSKIKKQAPPAAEEQTVDVGKLDIRVGKIQNIKIHPDADQLYVEQIDVGEEKCRTVISGLVKHIPLVDLDQRLVLVLCNLKPVKMRGIFSEAMVMCASTPEKVEVLSPPVGSAAGDKVVVPGFTYNPDLPFMNPKKKIFEQVAEDLKVDSNKRASYKNVPWKIENKEGDVTSQTLCGCNIK